LNSPDSPNILGINPWIYDFAAFNLWSRPAGLLACLDMLQRVGARVCLLDCMHPGGMNTPWPREFKDGSGHYPRTVLPRPDALKAVPRNWARYGLPMEVVRDWLLALPEPPDAVLLSSVMTYWYPGVSAMIQLLRDIWPRVPIVLGGIYATLCPDHARRQEADLVIQGPLEEPGNWSRLWEILKAPAPPCPPDAGLNLALDLYQEPGFSVLLGSRGCPFHCSYCASNALYPGFRRRSSQDLFALLRHEAMRGVRDFAFYDDALLVDARQWLAPWAAMVQSLRRPIRLHTPNAVHVRYLRPEVCAAMFDAGFATIRLGLETAVFDHRLDAKLESRHWSQGVTALLEAGFKPNQIGAYILFGLPDQDLGEVRESIEFVRSFGLRPHLTFYSPIPKTSLFEQACQASEHPLETEPLFHNPSLWPCIPGGFSWEQRALWRRLAKGE